ncbi:MAG TPA: hypothetical protein VGD65_25430 [Chryseosolibacter sp.]
MKRFFFLAASLLQLTCWAQKSSEREWFVDSRALFDLRYTAHDRAALAEYAMLFENGVAVTQAFFGSKFPKRFEVVFQPNRSSLDVTWQRDWNAPDFKSECWMVASGIATKVDILSPSQWKAEACEHNFSDKTKTQQLVTHELVHVYHGQKNASPDFSNTNGLDWFVEGLATYASGQCDSLRLAQVSEAVRTNQAPNTLDKFWSGKLKYGLAGSVVFYIDQKYGRTKLASLLTFNTKSEVLSSLGVTEQTLLTEWKTFMLKPKDDN